MNHFRVAEAIGLTRERRCGAESRGAPQRARATARTAAQCSRPSRSQSMEFREHAVEYGYAYASSAVVRDGTPPPDPVDDIRVYAPSTRPGAPLPHAWLEDPDGARCSTLDLVKPGRFLLIAGEDGADWCEAARAVAAEARRPARRGAHRSCDGRLPGPALRVARAPRDRTARRRARAPRPLRRLAEPRRIAGSARRAPDRAFTQILAKES